MQYLDGYRSQSNGPTLSITKISTACSTSSRRPIAENYISWAESAARTKRTEQNKSRQVVHGRFFHEGDHPTTHSPDVDVCSASTVFCRETKAYTIVMLCCLGLAWGWNDVVLLPAPARRTARMRNE